MSSHSSDPLFSVTSRSPLAPSPPFGTTDDATKAVCELLKHNHDSWHIFFNDRGFHNHASHHLLAIYSLGATRPLLKAAYKTHTDYQRPIYGNGEVITEANFTKHLGEREYYQSYLKYFDTLLGGDKVDVSAVLEKYIFSEKYNFEPEHPQMFNRFLSGLVHPLIHSAYGFEFGIKGLISEGLAQTVIHNTDVTPLLDRSFFEDFSTTPNNDISETLAQLSLNGKSNGTPPRGEFKLLSAIQKILDDDRLSHKALALGEDISPMSYGTAFKTMGPIVQEHVQSLDIESVGVVEGKLEAFLEELSVAQALFYGVAGWNENKKYNADFFLMHLVTSAILLPSLLAHLSPRSQRTLLRGYVASSLAWWIVRGRPALHIESFYKGSSEYPSPPLSGKAVDGKWLLSDEKSISPTSVANPWLAITETTLVHPNEHLCKLQRALLHCATAYGERPSEHYANSGLKGAELLDGSLYVRVAGLTAARLGWYGPDKPESGWDRHGFYQN